MQIRCFISHVTTRRRRGNIKAIARKVVAALVITPAAHASAVCTA
jgi:hypothetical protein